MEEVRMVNVRFNENTVHATRAFGAGEEHVMPESQAQALGESVTILGAAPVDFPRYDESVYGDNESAKAREPQDPTQVESVPAGQDNPEEVEIVGTEGAPSNEDYMEGLTNNDTVAPENKMVKGAAKKK